MNEIYTDKIVYDAVLKEPTMNNHEMEGPPTRTQGTIEFMVLEESGNGWIH